MPRQAVSSDGDCSEGHTNVKRDSRLLGQNVNAFTVLGDGQHPVEDVSHRLRLTREVLVHVAQAAGMRLVAIRERAMASRTDPEFFSCGRHGRLQAP